MKSNMIIRSQMLLFTAFTVLTTACGVSPLFNHENAEEKAQLKQSERNRMVLCGVKFEKLKLCVSREWIAQPSEEVGGVFRLRFWDETSGTSDGPYTGLPGKLKIYFWMPEHGHGSSPVVMTPLLDDKGKPLVGELEVSNIFFVMPGNWDTHVQVKNGAEVLDEVLLRDIAP